MHNLRATIENDEDSTASKAIVKTLIYSDIFDFPLTKEELWVFLKSDVLISKNNFQQVYEKAQPPISRVDTYYCLKGREEIIQQRKERTAISRKKYLLAEKTAKLLSMIPTIMFIGISGSVASGNASEDADIDLFVIVKKNTVWASRLCLLTLLGLLGLRRTKSMKEAKNKICINMILDEQSMLFSKNRQDTYTAHEIVQMMPLLNRNDTYKQFLQTNTWIKTHMPNSLEVKTNDKQQKRSSYPFSFFLMIESISRTIQIKKINKTKTTETISNNFLAFHPIDHRKRILQEYKKRLIKYRAE